MEVEFVNILNNLVPHIIVPMKGDGSCLFRAISYVMYNTQNMAHEVRKEIVHHVVCHWPQFKIMTHDTYGNNYETAAVYWSEMTKPFTYGGLCELVAAGQLYPYNFEVYRNGELYTRAGDQRYPARRLRFTDELSSGHFDAYILKTGPSVFYAESG